MSVEPIKHMDRTMPFPERLSKIRKQRGLTQVTLGQLAGITKTQVYRYENGSSQPTLDVIKNMAIALSVTSDYLIFEEGERQPESSMKLLFEGVSQLNDDEKHIIKELIEGIILKHQARLWTSAS